VHTVWLRGVSIVIGVIGKMSNVAKISNYFYNFPCQNKKIKKSVYTMVKQIIMDNSAFELLYDCIISYKDTFGGIFHNSDGYI